MTQLALPPTRGNRFSRAFGRAMLRLGGWRITSDVPAIPRFVAIVAPHTSNWDFVVGVWAMLALGLRVHWLGKHTIFRGPFARLFRWLGGMPVHRETAEGVVTHVVESMRAEPRFILALSPEGTRKRVERWRTGFHYIALGAGVPIVPVWLDWSTHTIGIGDPFQPSTDMDADVRALMRFFPVRMARHAEGHWE